MNEPFVDEQGEIVEREQSAVERELRLVKMLDKKFNTAMSGLVELSEALTEHGEEDMGSLLCALKVTKLNGALIAAATEWLKNRGASS